MKLKENGGEFEAVMEIEVFLLKAGVAAVWDIEMEAGTSVAAAAVAFCASLSLTMTFECTIYVS